MVRHNPKPIKLPIAFQTCVDVCLTAIAGLCLIVTLLPLVAVMGYVLYKGASRLDWALLTQLPPAAGLSGGGVANALVGTVLLVGLGTAIAVPIGVFAGIYLAELAPVQTAQKVRLVANILSGVPSILAGIFAYGTIVLATKTFSVLAGGVALAFVMLPLIVRATDASLSLVPQDLRWAAAAVGAARYQATFTIVLPAALPGVMTGIVLAIARAAGETAPLLFTALSAFSYPRGLLAPTPSLAVLIYDFATSPFPAQQELAWAASALLVLLVLLTSAVARRLLQ